MLFFCVVGEPTLLYNIGGFLVAKANAGHTGIAGGLFVTMIQKKKQRHPLCFRNTTVFRISTMQFFIYSLCYDFLCFRVSAVNFLFLFYVICSNFNSYFLFSLKISYLESSLMLFNQNLLR